MGRHPVEHVGERWVHLSGGSGSFWLWLARSSGTPSPCYSTRQPHPSTTQAKQPSGKLFKTRFRRRRAVITVAHRLATAREADRVIVLDRGRIIEQGTPRLIEAPAISPPGSSSNPPAGTGTASPRD